MKYKIFYTESAKQDLRNIHKYISEKLLEPKIAADLTNRIMKGIRSLEEMPMRYRLYESEPWHSRGLRVYPIENYVVFYLPGGCKDSQNPLRWQRYKQTAKRNLIRITISDIKHLSPIGAFFIPKYRNEVTKCQYSAAYSTAEISLKTPQQERHTASTWAQALVADV